MVRTEINTENTIFVLLSFEGPDVYSQAGGLGVRITNLSQTLAKEGFETHLFFIGDPHLEGEEISCGGQMTLHRWCQWISQYHPAGVYQGEEGKLNDYNKSIPPYLLEHIVRPAIQQDKLVVILAEEWHTAEVVCRTARLLTQENLRDRAVIFWNANNVFGFERIDFKALNEACTLTTVSRYMKHIMWRMGLNPLVIHNGIPKNLLNRVDPDLSSRLRRSLQSDLVLAKIARWDPDKRWNMAVEAAARLKARGFKTTLIARGGMESYGDEILGRARGLGLKVKDISAKCENIEDYLQAIADNCEGAEVLNLKFHCTQDFLRLIYHASDAVLANSGREPFGLVGLEAMAAGGVAFTGSTGEDYAISFDNSIVLDTSDPEEIESYVVYLHNHREEEERIRKAARHTAGSFTWEQIAENLVQRLEYQAKVQGAIINPESDLKLSFFAQAAAKDRVNI
jgi:glycosyltransferase involved in cell wall biosynthesis